MGLQRVRTADGLCTRSYEADVAAIDAGGRIVALGSCKWSTSAHPTAELDELQTVSQMLGIDLPPLYFFDRTGFSERLHEIARERSGVHLITTTDMS